MSAFVIGVLNNLGVLVGEHLKSGRGGLSVRGVDGMCHDCCCFALLLTQINGGIFVYTTFAEIIFVFLNQLALREPMLYKPQ